MKKNNDPHLCVDAGDDRATVDFLSHGVAVELSVRDGVFSVKMTASHGEEASSWDEHFVSWSLPQREPMVTVYPDGEEEFTTTLDDFLRDNSDDDAVVEAVRALEPGESVELGGGASPAFRVTRRM